MMNDRFAAQLRQHLVDAADERPASGQLAAIVERVDATPQRHPMVARLTWNPGLIGPFPTRALRYGLIALALLLAAVAAVVLGGGAPRGASTVFEGTWTSIDPGDGSTQTLSVGAGTTPAVRYVDGLATGLACQADTTKVFTADGTGAIVDGRLHVHWPDGGGCGLSTIVMADGSYAYDASTDRLIDGQDVAWTRALGGAQLPTRAPAADTPTDAPAPTTEPSPPSSGADSACPTFKKATAYRGTAGSLALTATVPGGEDWSGLSDAFHLGNGVCGRGSAAEIDASLVETVFADACKWSGSAKTIQTPAEAVALLAGQQGNETVGPTDGTIGGYPAQRFDVSVPADFDMSSCDDDGSGPFSAPDIYIYDGFQLDPGQTKTIYLVDVDGQALAIAATYFGDPAPSLVAQVGDILASLRITP